MSYLDVLFYFLMLSNEEYTNISSLKLLSLAQAFNTYLIMNIFIYPLWSSWSTSWKFNKMPVAPAFLLARSSIHHSKTLSSLCPDVWAQPLVSTRVYMPVEASIHPDLTHAYVS